MKLKIAWIGKTKDKAIQSLTDEYLKRLSRQASAVELRDEAALRALVSEKANPRHALVLLDSRGKQYTSEELARFLEEQMTRSGQPLLLAVGPADGFSEEARRAAVHTISLGKLTLPHELARIVLLEQVYRAFTILKGHPYHLGH